MREEWSGSFEIMVMRALRSSVSEISAGFTVTSTPVLLPGLIFMDFTFRVTAFSGVRTLRRISGERPVLVMVKVRRRGSMPRVMRPRSMLCGSVSITGAFFSSSSESLEKSSFMMAMVSIV